MNHLFVEKIVVPFAAIQSFEKKDSDYFSVIVPQFKKDFHIQNTQQGIRKLLFSLELLLNKRTIQHPWVLNSSSSKETLDEILTACTERLNVQAIPERVLYFQLDDVLTDSVPQAEQQRIIHGITLQDIQMVFDYSSEEFLVTVEQLLTLIQDKRTVALFRFELRNILVWCFDLFHQYPNQIQLREYIQRVVQPAIEHFENSGEFDFVRPLKNVLSYNTVG